MDNSGAQSFPTIITTHQWEALIVQRRNTPTVSRVPRPQHSGNNESEPSSYTSKPQSLKPSESIGL